MYWSDCKPEGAFLARRSSKSSIVMLLAGVLVARVIYLVWLCPYELVGDEAHYWEWSRRLALSYYSKGPGVAWVIWASTKVFGSSEWAIRVPSAVASTLTAWCLARLATESSRGQEPVGFAAAMIFCLLPIFHGTAQFMTIDGPYVCCWVLACWLAWRLLARIEQDQPAFGLWVALGVALGVGFLFKYTILLLIPGLLVHTIHRRRRHAWNRMVWTGALLGLGVFVCAISPVLIWNWQQGWPTWSHLLGRVHLPGGDQEIHHGWRYNPLWTLAYLASPLVLLGPLGAALMAYALVDRQRRDRRQSVALDESLHFAVSCAVPIFACYLLVSLGTDIELNWSIAGYTTLIIPLAQAVVAGLASPGRSSVVLAQSGRPDQFSDGGGGVLQPSRRNSLWKWFIPTSLVIILVMSFAHPALVARIPLIGAKLAVHRVSGHRAFAASIQAFAVEVEQRMHQTPFIIADSYWRASLLAYYLPERPVVYSAASRLGDRKSAYDYFADTNLADPHLFARPAILIGAAPQIWEKAFRFERVEVLSATGFPPIFVGIGYQGPLKAGIK